MSNFHVIIPARYHSSRLPAKPLAKIGEYSMIVHVCRRAQESGANSITVATDNQLIIDEVEAHGFTAVMTRQDHPSGSDRLYEAADLIGLTEDDIIINVQGDEPFIPPENIQLVASLLQEKTNKMSTLCCEINDYNELVDPNSVKVVFDRNGKAIYFSRSVIPFSRDKPIKSGVPLPSKYFRHIGIYGYRKNFLKQFINWQPSPMELAESLEQLRVVENGFVINIASIKEKPPHGVDTEQDLATAREYYAKSQKIN